jgi:hypothetical protein
MLFHPSGSKASQRHKHSSWQDLQGVADDEYAGDDVLSTADTNMAGGADSSSADSETAALLHRPATHVTLTVSRQGEDQAGRQPRPSSEWSARICCCKDVTLIHYKTRAAQQHCLLRLHFKLVCSVGFFG